MSTAKGGIGRRGQAHQNTFAFKHNPGSKKTAKILSIHHGGLCKRCDEKIEWRKKFRKYKPIKAPKKCQRCGGEQKVKRAYHIICGDCSSQLDVCPICTKEKPRQDEDEDDDELIKDARRANTREISKYLGTLRERDRRRLQREIEKGTAVLYYRVEQDELIVKKVKLPSGEAEEQEGDNDNEGEEQESNEGNDDEEQEANEEGEEENANEKEVESSENSPEVAKETLENSIQEPADKTEQQREESTQDPAEPVAVEKQD